MVPNLWCCKTMTPGSLPEIHRVYLSDEHLQHLDYNRVRLYFIDAAIWATKNCTSFKHYEIQEVNDVSTVYDQVAEYEFGSERDAMWFKLRWVR